MRNHKQVTNYPIKRKSRREVDRRYDNHNWHNPKHHRHLRILLRIASHHQWYPGIRRAPGKLGLQVEIPEEYVEEVIDDIRKGKAYCELCNQTSDSDKVCTNCGKTDYLEVFFDDDDEYES